MRVDVLKTFRAASDAKGTLETLFSAGESVDLPEHLSDQADGLVKEGFIKRAGSRAEKPAAASSAPAPTADKSLV